MGRTGIKVNTLSRAKSRAHYESCTRNWADPLNAKPFPKTLDTFWKVYRVSSSELGVPG